MRRHIGTLATVAGMICVGCAATPAHQDLPTFLKAHEHEVSATELRLGAGDTRPNVRLEPGDVVFVPPALLGWRDLKVRELLFPVEPAYEASTTLLDFQLVQGYHENNDLAGRRPRRYR